MAFEIHSGIRISRTIAHVLYCSPRTEVTKAFQEKSHRKRNIFSVSGTVIFFLFFLSFFLPFFFFFLSSYFLILGFLKHLYWSIIALQWCVSFCCITKWISYTHTYIPISSLCVSLLPSLSTPLGGHKAPSWSPCAMWLLPTSYLFYIW